MKIELLGFESGEGMRFHIKPDDDTELALLDACAGEDCTFETGDGDEGGILTCAVGI